MISNPFLGSFIAIVKYTLLHEDCDHTTFVGDGFKKKTVRDKEKTWKRKPGGMHKKWLKVIKNNEWGTGEVRVNELRVYEWKPHWED